MSDVTLPVSQNLEASPRKRRYVVLAVLLSLFMTGLGHAYAARPK